jgi:hypothetical protein
MNFNYLLPDRQPPSYFKVIALIIGAATISAALYFKISDAEDILGIAQKHFKFIYLIGLFILITSKNHFEDERIAELQLQIFRLSFIFLVGMITVFEITLLSGGESLSYERDFYSVVCSVLTLQVLFVELSKNTTVTDFVEKYHDLYSLIMLISFLLFFFIYGWIWKI